MQTLVPTEWVEWGRRLELVALVVHSRFVGVEVPQMWSFSPHTAVLAKPWPEPTVVEQVVCRKLLLWTGTSFLHSLELGFGKQHYKCCLVMMELQVVSVKAMAIGRPIL